MCKGAGFIVVAVAFAANLALGQVPSFVGTHAGQVRDDNGLKMKVVWCPPGTFTMGSPKDERDRLDDENQVQVTLTKGFWLGREEVTQSEWNRIMQTAPWKGKKDVKEGDNYPAAFVNWNEAMKFCEKLTEQETRAGRLRSDWQYILPTEAQWEYACRAGTKSRFSFGDDESTLGEYAWFAKNAFFASETYPHPAAQRKSNPWGLHDIHGNVFEWCRDGYQPQLRAGTDPLTPSSGQQVCRGGSWLTPAAGCRSAFRSSFAPDYRGYRLGFRVALERVGK
jgi:formylglycine-generating enzyme required for sulfatase activity